MKKQKLLLASILILIVAISACVQTGSRESSTEAVEIEVSLLVDYAGIKESVNESVGLAENSTAFDALAQNEDVEYEVYTGMGVFVTAINNVSSSDDYYWLYYVNGETPMVAADKYVLENNDIVEFKYTSAEEAMSAVE